MKKITLLGIAICTSIFAIAQNHNFDKRDNLQSLSNRLNLLEKKTDKFNLYFNFRGSLDTYDEGTDKMMSHFRVSNLRLEILGNLTDKLFYRLRHKLNRSNAEGTRDNLAGATDIFYAGYHFSDKFSLIFGKQFQWWGGFEYDLNPIYVYEFSDFGNNIDCFMLGATFVYNFNKNHELAFQVSDSRADKFEDFYGDLGGQNIQKSQTPLTYILNWNGNLWENKIKTRWAVGLQTDAKDKYTYSVAMGTMLNLPKFQLAVDYMRDNSDIDRLGIVSAEVKEMMKDARFSMPTSYKSIAENVKYNSLIAKAEFQPAKKWNVFLKGIYETATAKGFSDNYRKSYGYYAGLEYLPFEDQEMRLYLIYVGKKVDYSNIYLSNFDTNRISLGIIYRIKAF